MCVAYIPRGMERYSDLQKESINLRKERSRTDRSRWAALILGGSRVVRSGVISRVNYNPNDLYATYSYP